jgi:predicted MFS family arabinose efflux permease
MSLVTESARSRLVVTTTLGLAQILAWGSSYYLISVLAKPIGEDTGWPLSWIVGGLSLGFLVSGLVSPKVGRLIHGHGGRPVLAGSAVLLSVGLLLLAVAPNLPAYSAAWVVLGLAMGAGLYDPAFSTLGRLYGETARGAITQVTLFGGFASTVCWPLSAFMVDHIGWRGACAVYAAIHLVVTLPLYWFGLPANTSAAAPKSAATAPTGSLRPDHRIVFLLLAAALTLASVIMTVISIHLLTILQARGMALAAAVGLGALVGPSQVGARVLETLFGRKIHPVWSLIASTVLVAIGLGMLAGEPGVVGVGIVLYASGSGIRSIARGTVPLALFGRDGYAVLMGRLAMPMLVAQAASPFLGALLLDRFGTTATLTVLCVGAVVNIGFAAALVPFAFRRGAAVVST